MVWSCGGVCARATPARSKANVKVRVGKPRRGRWDVTTPDHRQTGENPYPSRRAQRSAVGQLELASPGRRAGDCLAVAGLGLAELESVQGVPGGLVEAVAAGLRDLHAADVAPLVDAQPGLDGAFDPHPARVGRVYLLAALL